ncbi:hypothetical protein GMI70_06905 [Eggerthellaceae bacterium zg-893]|nr:hypothetical protein [Eggerthellaceae bacterium zg-893]
MNAEVVGVARAKQRIRLSDDPDSPEFVLDLTATSLGRSLTRMLELANGYLEASGRADEAAANGDGDAYAEAAGGVAQAYEGIVAAMLGADAWDAVLGYVFDGEKPAATEVAVAVAPLVEYLLEKFNFALGVSRRKAKAKYLEPENDPDAI